MITLQKITSENCFDICDLEADERFVAPNEDSLIEAYANFVENGHGPVAFGIYHDETPVGFIMAEYCDGEECNNGEPYYYLWRLMIDNTFQGRGYGKAALELFLEVIRTFPLGKATKMLTSVVPENVPATRLYESLGFVKTGVMFDEEEGMELVL
ncbi:MAG: GNAT family N-acetyltransferase [Oscillospiraceae bacterium]|nr:GNAT family N-acetyltransferase [Oscillospiraceae bacterium]